MSVLLLTALVAAVFAALASQQYQVATSLQNTKKRSKSNYTTYYIFVFLCMATLVIVSGLRYEVGADYSNYYWKYHRYEMSFAESWKNWDEPGLPTLAKLLFFVSKDGAAFIFVIAAITISLYVITIAKNTNTFFFSIMLYMCVCWTGCFNGMRQYMASAVLFFGHRLMYERKFIKFCIVVFIASCFHITALIMLPMYFLITQVLDLKKILLIIVSGIAMIFSYDFLFQLVGIMKDTEAGGAETNYAQNEIHPLRILIALAPVILYFFLLFQKKGFTGTENFYMGLIFVRAAVIFGTSNSAYLNRVSIYFAPYICICLSLLVQKFPKNQQFMLKAIILILYFVVWMYIEVMGIEWKWIFERTSTYVSVYYPASN